MSIRRPVIVRVADGVKTIYKDAASGDIFDRDTELFYLEEGMLLSTPSNDLRVISSVQMNYVELLDGGSVIRVMEIGMLGGCSIIGNARKIDGKWTLLHEHEPTPRPAKRRIEL